ncbi:MAG: divalent metal cation transporter, partial [Flavobacteriaceae bacterium]|nr:divalent metal cation transporter [Flavobacteriaceae bacterium]
LDISIWHSLWALEKNKENKSYSVKSSLFDFNVGYTATIFIGFCFMLLGTLVMFQSGERFSAVGTVFSNQLISMYTKNLGSWAYVIIGIAAFTTMFSTTLTTLDASPRAMVKTYELLLNKKSEKGYLFWMVFLIFGTLAIFFLFQSEMVTLITIATILSFLTAPFYAIVNYLLISGKHTPKEWRPSLKMHLASWIGILFLMGFSIWYLTTLKHLFTV